MGAYSGRLRGLSAFSVDSGDSRAHTAVAVPTLYIAAFLLDFTPDEGSTLRGVRARLYAG